MKAEIWKKAALLVSAVFFFILPVGGAAAYAEADDVLPLPDIIVGSDASVPTFPDSKPSDSPSLPDGGEGGQHGTPERPGLALAQGWNFVEGAWYWADAAGVSPRKGWLREGSAWYWLDPSRRGAMATGLFDAYGVRYMARPSGEIEQNGWFFRDGGWYFASSSGALASGWLKDSGAWYWLDPMDFALASGVFHANGIPYVSDSRGAVVQDGWAECAGLWYLADSSGALLDGWQKWKGQWYWLDRETRSMKTGWFEQGGDLYWLRDWGAMACGPFFADGAWRLADMSGSVFADRAAWRHVAGEWYYVGEGGILAEGWFDDAGKRYFFSERGAMACGWLFYQGSWYWLGPDGAMKSGWACDVGCWYWLDPTTGVMQTGWLQLEEGWYWLNPSGAMATGWVGLGGSPYKFDRSGLWVEDTGKVLNVSRSRIVEWLWAHESDGYYVGTPYSSNFDVLACMYPIGNPRWDGFVGMNCTGMVAHAYGMSGGFGDFEAIGNTHSYSPWLGGPGGGGYINAWRWYGYAVEHGAEMYVFDSVADMLASGKADKGDILFFKTNGSIDCHIGFFWGDTPYENRMWHQIYPYNCISTCFNNANKNEVHQQAVLIKGC